MRTSRTGTWTRRNGRTGGFTLVELILVLVVLGIALALVVPQVGGVDSLGSVSRPLIGLIRTLHTTASTTKQPYRLYVDLDEQAYWATVVAPDGERSPSDPDLARRRILPASIRIRDAATPAQGIITSGQAVLSFAPVGRVDSYVLHLVDESQQVLTLQLNPLTGGVKVLDTDVASQERSGIPEHIRALLLPV